MQTRSKALYSDVVDIGDRNAKVFVGIIVYQLAKSRNKNILQTECMHFSR